MVEKHHQKRTVHDFFSEEKWAALIAGYRTFKKGDPKFILYAIYRAILYPFQVFVIAMCFTAATISFGNTAVTIQAIHVSLLVFVGFLGLSLRLVAGKVLVKTYQILRSGIYHYREGPFDEDHDIIKSKYVTRIRKLNKTFHKMVTMGTLSNAIIVPLIQLMVVDESSGERMLNPYLPQPVYMPFNTRTVVGYSVAFIINVLFIVMVVSIVTCMNCIFISCTLQLKAQYEILNYSVRNLERRAYAYVKKTNFDNRHVFSSTEFLDSMYECFRSNVKHHQALLRLKRTFETCFEFIFLTVIGLASVVLAAHLLLILEVPEIHIMANFIVTLLCEMLYTLHYCWCGEELIFESGEVYNSIYFTPWYNCDSRFKKLLSIMISNTRNPVQIKALGFDVTASLNSFGTIISTMYQVINLVRST